MLSDPINLTGTEGAVALTRIGVGDGFARYRTADLLTTLSISHAYKTRNRHSVRFDRTKIAADPFDADINQEYSYSVYTVFDIPRLGVSVADAASLYSLINNFFDLSSAANVSRILQGES